MRNDKGNLALTGRVPLVVFCIKASKFNEIAIELRVHK